MKTRLLATVAALGALAASGTAQAQIKLGAILSISGPGAAMGVGYKGAFDLFPTEIAGQKVEYIIRDDATDASTGYTIAQKMISRGPCRRLHRPVADRHRRRGGTARQSGEGADARHGALRIRPAEAALHLQRRAAAVADGHRRVQVHAAARREGHRLHRLLRWLGRSGPRRHQAVRRRPTASRSSPTNAMPAPTPPARRRRSS